MFGEEERREVWAFGAERQTNDFIRTITTATMTMTATTIIIIHFICAFLICSVLCNTIKKAKQNETALDGETKQKVLRE